MYVDNVDQSLSISQMTVYDCKALTSTGGVFMFVNVKTVTISNSRYQRFGPGSFGTFMYT